ncbi:hypothetical protein M427DRAFT_162892 [Gonapodya prolifera JEL478]|uniref:C2H2-type domain-containing protein n=1 Tax=Gonapodya prolifera (strain JEL478) TaxID=1344416 RepID=A0A139AZ94_GONPJ|nr:hypothetical protein M427DRAFT_162892 [Gonapodya prolifera JEL478]|eukprot:KXS22051.1 hypothetical protein M427DRAFT_162892 [Gonapodya prolifera JEL478]
MSTPALSLIDNSVVPFDFTHSSSLSLRSLLSLARMDSLSFHSINSIDSHHTSSSRSLKLSTPLVSPDSSRDSRDTRPYALPRGRRRPWLRSSQDFAVMDRSSLTDSNTINSAPPPSAPTHLESLDTSLTPALSPASSFISSPAFEESPEPALCGIVQGELRRSPSPNSPRSPTLLEPGKSEFDRSSESSGNVDGTSVLTFDRSAPSRLPRESATDSMTTDRCGYSELSCLTWTGTADQRFALALGGLVGLGSGSLAGFPELKSDIQAYGQLSDASKSTGAAGLIPSLPPAPSPLPPPSPAYPPFPVAPTNHSATPPLANPVPFSTPPPAQPHLPPTSPPTDGRLSLFPRRPARTRPRASSDATRPASRFLMSVHASAPPFVAPARRRLSRPPRPVVRRANSAEAELGGSWAFALSRDLEDTTEADVEEDDSGEESGREKVGLRRADRRRGAAGDGTGAASPGGVATDGIAGGMTKVFDCPYPECVKWFYGQAQLRAHTKAHEDRGEVLVETDGSASESEDGDSRARTGTSQGSETWSIAGSGGIGGKRHKVMWKMVAMESLTEQEMDEDVEEMRKGVRVSGDVDGGVERSETKGATEKGSGSAANVGMMKENEVARPGKGGKDHKESKERREAPRKGEAVDGVDGKRKAAGKENGGGEAKDTSGSSSSGSGSGSGSGTTSTDASSTTTSSTKSASTSSSNSASTTRSSARRVPTRNRPTASPAGDRSESSDEETEPRRSRRKSGGPFEEESEDGTLLVNGIDNFPRCAERGCGKWFYSRASLKSHMRNHHGIEDADSLIPPAPSPLSVAIAGVAGLSERHRSPSKKSGAPRSTGRGKKEDDASSDEAEGVEDSRETEGRKENLNSMRGQKKKVKGRRGDGPEQVPLEGEGVAALVVKTEEGVSDDVKGLVKHLELENGNGDGDAIMKDVDVDKEVLSHEVEMTVVNDTDQSDVHRSQDDEFDKDGDAKVRVLDESILVQFPMEVDTVPDGNNSGRVGGGSGSSTTPGKKDKGKSKSKEARESRDRGKVVRDDSGNGIDSSGKIKPERAKGQNTVSVTGKPLTHRKTLSATAGSGATTRRNSMLVEVHNTGARTIPKDDTFETLDEFPRCHHPGCEKW